MPRAADAASLLKTRGPLPLGFVADVVRTIATQLDGWADECLGYGSVRPENIDLILDQQNLLDARLTGFPSRPEVLSPTVLMANARYVAPELLRGIAFESTADIWALGCTASELLTGTSPLAGGTVAEVMASATRGTARRRELPGDVGVVIGTALAPDPRDRYETASEFAAALRRACGLS